MIEQDERQRDLVVIGAGIIGLATAYRYIERFPDRSVTILEKETELAIHQTGHNSGVLHSGVYYKPGSMKAINCREGKKAMQEFLAREDIPFEICGKVIVALDDKDLEAMNRIYERGQANGVLCKIIDKDELAEIEPHTAGIAAISVPEAGIVDYKRVCERLGEIIVERGGRIVRGARVTAIRSESDVQVVQSTQGDIEAKSIVNCSGLQSDRVAKLSGLKPDAKIIPFRGEYYELEPEAEELCRHLIYPVPDPSFPFLGVHFTRMIHGGIECGPNAVLAFAREGYKLSNINLRDLTESLTYPGFLRMASKHWKTGFGEMWRSISKAAFVKALQRLVPAIKAEHLVAAPAGVRAQAVSRDGSLVDDFAIQNHGRLIHVGNAPSPGATSSLNIGKTIVERLEALDA